MKIFLALFLVSFATVSCRRTSRDGRGVSTSRGGALQPAALAHRTANREDGGTPEVLKPIDGRQLEIIPLSCDGNLLDERGVVRAKSFACWYTLGVF